MMGARRRRDNLDIPEAAIIDQVEEQDNCANNDYQAPQLDTLNVYIFYDDARLAIIIFDCQLILKPRSIFLMKI